MRNAVRRVAVEALKCLVVFAMAGGVYLSVRSTGVNLPLTAVAGLAAPARTLVVHAPPAAVERRRPDPPKPKRHAPQRSLPFSAAPTTAPVRAAAVAVSHPSPVAASLEPPRFGGAKQTALRPRVAPTPRPAPKPKPKPAPKPTPTPVPPPTDPQPPSEPQAPRQPPPPAPPPPSDPPVETPRVADPAPSRPPTGDLPVDPVPTLKR